MRAITQYGETVILLDNGTWKYVDTLDNKNPTLSEQFDEIYTYAKDKLGLRTKKYNNSTYEYENEARIYAKEYMEKHGNFSITNKTLLEQFDEVYNYAKDKLGLRTKKYNNSTYEYENEARIYAKEYMEKHGNFITTNKTLTEQFDEVYTYAKDKLGLKTKKYNNSTYEYENEARIYAKEYMEKHGN
jgi:hypothetical protein